MVIQLSNPQLPGPGDSQKKDGTRGGLGLFRWAAVEGDKDRACYLGNSEKAYPIPSNNPSPFGRWHRHKDLNWYKKQAGKSTEDNLDQEIEEMKRTEAIALHQALNPATGAEGYDARETAANPNNMEVGERKPREVEREVDDLDEFEEAPPKVKKSKKSKKEKKDKKKHREVEEEKRSSSPIRRGRSEEKAQSPVHKREERPVIRRQERSRSRTRKSRSPEQRRRERSRSRSPERRAQRRRDERSRSRSRRSSSPDRRGRRRDQRSRSRSSSSSPDERRDGQRANEDRLRARLEEARRRA
jgi:hypothetical protein